MLFQKAIEIGDTLYKAFDTPNRMRLTRWNFKAAAGGVVQEAGESVLVSEIGSPTFEFTRLSQLSGDPRYFDAIQHVMDVFEDQQDKTNQPSMWPVVINVRTGDFTGFSGFTIGGMADSLYEYLPKEHMLLRGATQQYRRLYEYAVIVIKRNIFHRPMTFNGEDVRLTGQVDRDARTPSSETTTEPQAQHLDCFAGGMVAIAAKISQNDNDLALAQKRVARLPLGLQRHAVWVDARDIACGAMREGRTLSMGRVNMAQQDE
ncbi:MAG: hypothetical protein M1818_004106 [Claussenomyces sp. TS43310]|nr:MAG: hypothetical protein M1818_004106 [Claussenomyces sp. TS43310]